MLIDSERTVKHLDRVLQNLTDREIVQDAGGFVPLDNKNTHEGKK